MARPNFFRGGSASDAVMPTISRDNPCLSLTSVAHDRLPAFRTEALKNISERFFLQRVNYIHQNPVRAGLAEQAEDYRWSSVRCWKGWPREGEPLVPDLDKIVWRKPR